MRKSKATKESLKDVPTNVKAEMALKEAVAQAIAEHKKAGRQ